MSRPVRALTGCLPHATAHDKRPPACRPPEFLFPRRFNCGTWRGNNFSAGTFPTGNTPSIPPAPEGIPHRLLPAGNPQHPRFTLKQPLDSPSPRLRLVTPDAIPYIRSPVESSMRTNVLILGTNQSGTGRMS